MLYEFYNIYNLVLRCHLTYVENNLVFYKSMSYLSFCTSRGVHKIFHLIYQQISITGYILNVGTSSTHHMSDTWSDNSGQTS